MSHNELPNGGGEEEKESTWNGQAIEDVVVPEDFDEGDEDGDFELNEEEDEFDEDGDFDEGDDDDDEEQSSSESFVDEVCGGKCFEISF